MTYKDNEVRSGLTAIAAVLALSSTPLFAQETTTPDPVAETAPEPAPAADPLGPEPAASEPEAAETTATPAAPAETATTSRRTGTRTQKATTTTTARRATSEPANSASPSRTEAVTEATAQPTPVPPPTAAMVEPGPMPVEEPVAETTAQPVDDALPIAGAAGLGLLALGGIGMAVGRRHRRKEELAHMKANREYLDSHPVAETPEPRAPAFAHTAAPAMAGPAAALTDVPRTKLPANFDLSRFGPHVRAAYQGPTADNPSLSLKHRLRRAAAMDQKARQQSSVDRPAQRPAPRAEPSMKPLWENGDSFMLRRAPGKPAAKPAFQH